MFINDTTRVNFGIFVDIFRSAWYNDSITIIVFYSTMKIKEERLCNLLIPKATVPVSSVS